MVVDIQSNCMFQFEMLVKYPVVGQSISGTIQCVRQYSHANLNRVRYSACRKKEWCIERKSEKAEGARYPELKRVKRNRQGIIQLYEDWNSLALILFSGWICKHLRTDTRAKMKDPAVTRSAFRDTSMYVALLPYNSISSIIQIIKMRWIMSSL